MIEPDNPCRVMETRECPFDGVCEGRCMRFDTSPDEPAVAKMWGAYWEGVDG